MRLGSCAQSHSEYQESAATATVHMRLFTLARCDLAGAGLFAFTGTAILSKATAGAEPNVVWAALGNGFALAIASEGFPVA